MGQKRAAQVVIAVGELRPGFVFEYDPEVDERINSLVHIGVVKDLYVVEDADPEFGAMLDEQAEAAVSNPRRTRARPVVDVESDV